LLTKSTNFDDVDYLAVGCAAESGRYVALDLGGTNFRVLLVELKADSGGAERPNVVSKVFLIPLKIMLGTAQMASHSVHCRPMQYNVQHLYEYNSTKYRWAVQYSWL